MDAKRKDPRVVRTRQLLRKALIELMTLSAETRADRSRQSAAGQRK